MPAFELEPWHDFFVAEAGASAALAGLLFVAVSINIAKILQFVNLPGRAAEALMYLVSVLLVATLGLVPEQPLHLLGVEVLVISGVILASSLRMVIGGWKRDEQQAWWVFTRLFSSLIATVPFLIGGMALVLGAWGGLYWLPVGMTCAILAGVISSWVLLVEILR